MDDLGFIHHQLQVNPYEEMIKPPLFPSYGNTFQHSGSNQTLSCKTSMQIDHPSVLDRPIKQMRLNNWDNPQDSSPKILSFANSNCSAQLPCLLTPKEEAAVSPVTYPSDMLASQAPNQNHGYIFDGAPHVARKSSSSDRLAQASKEHIIAERKRREKLSQRFIALSAMVPGLKKVRCLLSFVVHSFSFGCLVVL